jgi:polyvinyl alcohol dehydrogenase (cytochrome)
MDSGVMRLQASGLSPAERDAVARYLSGAETGPLPSAGRCAAGDVGVLAPVRVRDWGMSPDNARAVSSGDTSIRAETASRLQLDWVFAFPGASRARVQPTLAGDTLFTADQFGVIYALNAGTGCIRWTVSTEREIRSSLIIEADGAGAARRLYFGDYGGWVHALDVSTRSLVWSVRPEAHPQTTITGAPRLHEGRLYVPISSLEVVAAMDGKYACCTFRGALAVLDASTGSLIWKTYMIDETPVQQGVNRDGAAMFGPSGAPVWGSPTLDLRRGRIYVGTGENYSHPASDKSDSIVALDMKTGRIEWSFQALGQDVWNAACSAGANCPVNTGPDYDFGAPPVLVDLPSGRSLVLAGQKSGRVFALDPDRQGSLAWSAKPGRGGIMGGVHWGMTTDGSRLYAPVSDLTVYPQDAHLPAQSGLHALDIASGQAIWSRVLPDTCGQTSWRCSPGLSAPATAAPGVIFGASLDGKVHAFSASDGSVLWSFDTNREFETVNGVKGAGGGIDSAGPVLAGDRLYIVSGYDRFGQKAGNLLMSFRPK